MPGAVPWASESDDPQRSIYYLPPDQETSALIGKYWSNQGMHGIAVKAGLQLGLLSSEASRRFSPIGRGVRKRTWFSYIVLDRYRCPTGSQRRYRVLTSNKKPGHDLWPTGLYSRILPSPWHAGLFDLIEPRERQIKAAVVPL
ncbi:uncharacterized protein BJX67DRAFT_378590 [Aspergillus lucknowensis]|uniref:Transcription factor domain-containing protein n=1 Tax=Aspergillus lucknowensis TaxID=176173 RepID=A0ABR4LZU3_9EURO